MLSSSDNLEFSSHWSCNHCRNPPFAFHLGARPCRPLFGSAPSQFPHPARTRKSRPAYRSCTFPSRSLALSSSDNLKFPSRWSCSHCRNSPCAFRLTPMACRPLFGSAPSRFPHLVRTRKSHPAYQLYTSPWRSLALLPGGNPGSPSRWSCSRYRKFPFAFHLALQSCRPPFGSAPSQFPHPARTRKSRPAYRSCTFPSRSLALSSSDNLESSSHSSCSHYRNSPFAFRLTPMAHRPPFGSGPLHFLHPARTRKSRPACSSCTSPLRSLALSSSDSLESSSHWSCNHCRNSPFASHLALSSSHRLFGSGLLQFPHLVRKRR